MVGQHSEMIRRKAKSEMPDGRRAQPALLRQVLHGFPAVFRVEQALPEKFCGAEVHLIHPLPGNRLRLLRLVVLRNGNSRPVGKKAHCSGIVQIFLPHDESDHVPAGAATKAIKASGRRKNRKGRRSFAMKGAKTVQVGASPLEGDVRADHLLDVTAVNDLVNDLSRDHTTGPFQTFGINSSE